MNKQRVAIIAGQLVVGGSEKQLYFWLSKMPRDRFDPVVVTLHPDSGDYWEKPIESLGIPLLRERHRGSPLFRLLHLVRMLAPFRPQLIHGWNLFTSVYAGVLGKLLGSRSMGSLRDNLRIFNANPCEARLTQYLVDGIVVNSSSAASELASAGKCRRQKIFVVQNAVDEQTEEKVSMRNHLREKFGLSHNQTLIGAMGRFVPKKRFDMLLDVVGSLRRSSMEIHLLVIGDGPLAPELKKMAVDLGIADHVTFTGENPNGRSWLSALDIFCFTGLDEGLPNVVMEAAVAGIPVVAWRTPFLEELLGPRDTSLLIEAGDLVAMQEALRSLIVNADLRLRLGQEGHRRVVNSFGIAQYVEKMTAAYEDLLGAHRRH